AAQSRKQVAVYLKSGDVVYGRIIAHDSLGNYRISNDCGITQLSQAEIDYIGKDRFSRPDLKKSGYFNQSSIALLFGEGQDGFQPIPSLTMVNGWQWNQKIFTGLGLGYEHFDIGVIPLFAEGMYLFGNESFAPFLSFRIGYSFPLGEQETNEYYATVSETYGGINLSSEAGISIAVGSKSALLVSIGYHHQELSYKETTNMWNNYDKTVFTNYNRISLKLGFVFQ
ncbi:MAG: hypothetical protein HGA37_16925, partial [Lentimicrobium sp.]|nr:hypothetical protein [Lentimicrobium sp.]